MKIVCFAGTLALFALPCCCVSEAHAEGCTPNHELYRIVPKYRAVMLDGGEIKRQMFVDWKDERLSTWKPGNNITFCPDQDKMINTTINSIATLLSEVAMSSCKPLLVSNAIDRALESAWEYTNQPNLHVDPTVFVNEAKRELGWYWEVCLDYKDGGFEKDDFKEFTIDAASLTRVDMSTYDPANASMYKARAAKYEKWRDALYAAEGNKSWSQRILQKVFPPN